MAKKSKSKKASAQRSAGVGKAVRPAQEQRGFRRELLWLLPALVAGLVVYLNTLHGNSIMTINGRSSATP